MITTDAPVRQDGRLAPGDPARFAAQLQSPLPEGAVVTLRLTAAGTSTGTDGPEVLAVPMEVDGLLLSVTLTVEQVGDVVGDATGFAWAQYRITAGSGDDLVALFAGVLRVTSQWEGVASYGVALLAGVSEAQAARISASAAEAARVAAAGSASSASGSATAAAGSATSAGSAKTAAEAARDEVVSASDTAATPNKVAKRTSTGALAVATAVNGTEATSLDQMNAAFATLAERTVKAFLPPRIYTVIGRQTDVYFWNFIRASNPDAYAVRDDYRTADVMNLGDRYRIIPTATLTQSINLRVWDCEYQAATALTSLRHVSDASKPTVNALVIGDSMTDAGVWLAEVKRLMGANLTLRGSRSTTVNDSIGGSQTVAHEGRSGWSVNNYVASASYGALGTNPFYSGGTFNFGYYMANTGAGYGTLTDVFIMLGTNDVGQSIATATIVNNIKAIANSIRAFNAAIKIHVILEPPPIRSGYGFGTRNWTNLLIQKNAMHDLWVALRPELLSLSVDMIAAGLVVDCWYDFPQTTVAQSQRNPTVITVGNENVHPNSFGYWKIADLVYAHMIGYTP